MQQQQRRYGTGNIRTAEKTLPMALRMSFNIMGILVFSAFILTSPFDQITINAIADISIPYQRSLKICVSPTQNRLLDPIFIPIFLFKNSLPDLQLFLVLLGLFFSYSGLPRNWKTTSIHEAGHSVSIRKSADLYLFPVGVAERRNMCYIISYLEAKNMMDRAIRGFLARYLHITSKLQF